MNGETPNNNNVPQNDRVSEDAAKSLQNILNSVRTSVENEFAIQQMEYEELYGVDSQEYENYLNKVGSWLKANKLIDMVMDLLPISLVMDMATSQDSLDQPDPNISPTLPSMPIPQAVQQFDQTAQSGPQDVHSHAPVPQMQVPPAVPEPVSAPAQVQAPAPESAPVNPWGPPPDTASPLPPVSDDSIPAVTQPVQPEQQVQNAGPNLDSIFPQAQPGEVNTAQAEIPDQNQISDPNLPQASPHEMAAQKSAYIPNNAWQSADPEMKAPSMPMPPPPPPKPQPQEEVHPNPPEGIGMDIPDDQFSDVSQEAGIDDSMENASVPPPVPPIPPKMPPPPPPKNVSEPPPSVPFMPPAPPPKGANAQANEPPVDLFDELRQSQATEAQIQPQPEDDGFQSGTWANHPEQEQPSANEVLAAPQEDAQPQAPAVGWEQVSEQPVETNAWGPPQQSQEQENEPVTPQPVQDSNPWGPPPGSSQPIQEPAVQSPPQPQAPPPQAPADNAWGAPQPAAPQAAANPWGAPPEASQHAPEPAVQAQPQVQAPAQPQPPAPPQNGQGTDQKKEEKDGDSFVFDPSTAWG